MKGPKIETTGEAQFEMLTASKAHVIYAHTTTTTLKLSNYNCWMAGLKLRITASPQMQLNQHGIRCAITAYVDVDGIGVNKQPVLQLSHCHTPQL
jgi:hypothetical protein